MLSAVVALSELAEYMKHRRETISNETRAREKTTAALLLLQDSNNRAKQAGGRVKMHEDDPLELLSDPSKEIVTICNAQERN